MTVEKNILLIGASGEIGQATAVQLARDGHRLILHYNRNHLGIEQIQHQIEMTQILSIVQSDLTQPGSAEELLNALPFSINAVIFAAGETFTGVFQQTPEHIMDKLLMQHVKAPWLITKRLLPSMIQSGNGAIIFITSIWGEYGAGMEVVYSAVKGAQNSFVKALAQEVVQTGVAVNAVSPGYIDTKMNAFLSQEEQNALFQDIPLKRAGTANDVALGVRFLLKETISLQGSIMPVNGGWIPG